MRILIATGLYPPEIGGPATYAKLFEERLPSHGIDVSVLPFRSVRGFPPIIRHFVYAWLVARRIHGVDLVLVQDTVSTGLPVALIAMLAKKKFVVRVPGDYAWEQGAQRFGVRESLDDFQKHSYGIRVALLRAIQRFVVRRAFRVIAPSKYLAGVVSGWLEHPRDIEVIYNGIDLKTMAEQREREKNLIVSSGRLVPWKGFDELIDIVAAHSDWHLEILGNGPQRNALEEQIQKKGVEERVVLRGALSHEDVQTCFARATVFALNSRYEGLSHTLVEAFAAGTPVIATRVGGNPEVVRDGVNGILVEAGDIAGLEKALTRFLSDQSLREKMGEAAKERSKDFSVDTTVEATVSLLKSCVS